jgi:hypothetical protein
MASLVQALAAGIAAAPSGSAEFFTLGTSTLSTLVYDGDGNAVTSTTLDEFGFAERYVKEPVTVKVYKADRSFLRQFDHVEDAKVVRLESPAFTGPNDTGSIVAGGQTTEQAAWSLFLASFGATDAYVSISSGAVLLKTLLASVTEGILFNIVGFGADPTGTADSTAYVQATINAAAAAGGGPIFVPPGTYKISATISVPAGVWFLGVFPVSIFRQTVALPFGMFSLSTGGMFGVRLEAAASCTGYLIRYANLTTGVSHLIQCEFAPTTGQCINHDDTTDIRVIGCSFARSTSTANTSFYVNASTAAAVAKFDTCTFVVTGATAPTKQFDSVGTIETTNCQFTHATGASAIFGAGSTAIVTGGHIENTGATAALTVSLGGLTISGTRITAAASGSVRLIAGSQALYDNGCDFDPTNSNVTVGAVTTRFSRTREQQKAIASAVTTSYTPAAANFGVHVYTQTGGAAFTLNNPSTDCGPFGRLIVIWYNNSGSNITPAFGTGYAMPTAAIVNTGSAAMWEMVKGDGTTTSKYVAVGPQTVFTP